MFRRVLSTGVVVEVEKKEPLIEMRLINEDRTAEWIISEVEAETLEEGLNTVIDGV